MQLRLPLHFFTHIFADPFGRRKYIFSSLMIYHGANDAPLFLFPRYPIAEASIPVSCNNRSISEQYQDSQAARPPPAGRKQSSSICCCLDLFDNSVRLKNQQT
jgi:hypothetical protein